MDGGFFHGPHTILGLAQAYSPLLGMNIAKFDCQCSGLHDHAHTPVLDEPIPLPVAGSAEGVRVRMMQREV